jgi:biopolymer transport protein ExbD
MADLADLGEDIAPISSINVTPFVDVVLVLLVIFMVTAPILMKDSIGKPRPVWASPSRRRGRSFSTGSWYPTIRS